MKNILFLIFMTFFISQMNFASSCIHPGDESGPDLITFHDFSLDKETQRYWSSLISGESVKTINALVCVFQKSRMYNRIRSST